MTSRVQTNRVSTTGTRPPNTRPVGEFFVNFADNQLGVIDPTPTARDLLPIRFHSPTAAYAINDLVRQTTGLYQAKAAIPAHAFNASEWNQFVTAPSGTATVGWAIGNIPGPLVSSGGGNLPMLNPNNRLIFRRQNPAAGDNTDFQFDRTTTFTGGTLANINRVIGVFSTQGAGDATQTAGIIATATTNSTAAGYSLPLWVQAIRAPGSNGWIWGAVISADDRTGLASGLSSASNLAGIELDMGANRADSATNPATFGGIGNRKAIHVALSRSVQSDATATEYSTGVWFSTNSTFGGGAVDTAITLNQAIGFQPGMSIRTALDTRGAITSTGSANPVSAVTMSAGHVIDFNGGPALNSAPGNYLQYTTTGTPRLRYMAGATEVLYITNLGDIAVARNVTATAYFVGTTNGYLAGDATYAYYVQDSAGWAWRYTRASGNMQYVRGNDSAVLFTIDGSGNGSVAQSWTAGLDVNAQRNVVAAGTVQGGYVNSTGNVNANSSVTASVDISAARNISAGAALFAHGSNIVIGPGGSGRVMQMAGGYYWDFNTTTGDAIWVMNNQQCWVMSPLDGRCYNNIAWVGGHGAYRDVSDERLKTDITPATVGLPEILAIEPINFHRLGPEGEVYPADEIGFSAQNVQPIIPEAVTEAGIGLPDALAVASEMILAAVVNAIKTLDQRITVLEAT